MNGQPRQRVPGVHLDFIAAEQKVEFRTGVPVFVGFGELIDRLPQRVTPDWIWLTSWNQFEQSVRVTIANSFLRYAIRGFFENGGEICVVVVQPEENLTLDALEEPFKESLRAANNFGKRGILQDIEDIDLVCVPDIMMECFRDSEDSITKLQQTVLEHCEDMNDRFAILDALPVRDEKWHGNAEQTDIDIVSDQRYRLRGSEGALYYPWVCVRALNPSPDKGLGDSSKISGDQTLCITEDDSSVCFVPPCGHIAGVYSHTDRHSGVHKAPANELVKGALDLQVSFSPEHQADLNNASVNCLRSFARRGIRVWGARTLSIKPGNHYVNIRRLILTLVRWAETNMRDFVFENNGPLLWERIRHRLEGYCFSLLERGALKGQNVGQAYFVKCDEELNTSEVRNRGQVLVDIGLAAEVPAEFIVVRITRSATGLAATLPIG